MEIIMKFDGSNVDDMNDYKIHMKANDMGAVLWGFKQFIREKVKHDERADYSTNEFVKKFDELCDEYDVNIYELWS